MLWVAVVALAAVAAVPAAAEAELGCFCDCMKNRCMTLGAGADKYDCAAACTEGCTQIASRASPGMTTSAGSEQALMWAAWWAL
ncbi:hypothetical protein HU200_023524 [Digitaria exilis]|uniref:Uncharacterized protein n=1 Tax=Digitaria exilis TaxID=1010633 RepID=A0A835C645_9POAL|nr:hypothetical protein HU200_023524 [Digitaria exilis]